MIRLPRMLFKTKVFLCLVAATLIWQLSFLGRSQTMPETERINHACSIGACDFYAVYWNAAVAYYHTGEFPVLPPAAFPEPNNREAVLAFLDKHHADLLNDHRYATRMGETGKVFLFYPSLWLGLENPTIRPVIVVAFLLALVLVLWASLRYESLLFGGLLVFFLGSSPVLLYENYVNLNLHGFTTAILLIAASSAALLASRVRSRRALGVVALVLGLLLGALQQVRSEVYIAALAFFPVFLVLSRNSWRERFACLLLAFVIVQGFRAGAGVFWTRTFESSRLWVQARGGKAIPAEVPRPLKHEVWHNITIGLGDFDDRYGFRYDDQMIYELTLPELNRRLGTNYERDGYALKGDWGVSHAYYRRSCDFPVYDQIVREIFFDHIKKDPKWYARILAKRVQTVFTRTSPFALSWRSFEWRWLEPKWANLLAGLLFLVAIVRGRFRRPFVLAVVGVSFLTAAVPMLVTTAAGASYLALQHYFLLAGAIALNFGPRSEKWRIA